MKKIMFILAAFAVAGLLVACSINDPANNPAQDTASGRSDTASDRLSIVTTIFPEYDWVRNIMGERAGNAEITMLVDSGVDLHSYQPSAADILKIATCDLFIYVGGESDQWVHDAIQESTNENMKVLCLMDLMGDRAKEEEIVEGMESEEEEDEEEGEEPEYDEHVWLSLRNAASLCNAISEALTQIDPEGGETYSSNVSKYTARLDELDQAYSQAVEAAPVHTLLFGDRFPFRYLTDDYGLDYYAAFAGCSAETEASFETIIFLANKVDELALHSVLTIEGADHSIAETVIANTASADQQILTLDSMQSVTAQDVKEGASYISIAESNLDVLKEALK